MSIQNSENSREFSNLVPGQSYRAEIINPLDFECTLANLARDDELDSDFIDHRDGTGLTADPDHENPISRPDLTWDAGLRRAPTGKHG